ncbi:phenylacetate--CoA ligase family protein [Promicromonospora sp. NPDC057138]|uniref:phenylacetate--CoA ligase family protein n=1 Tax=Promicromonospora sp. NPDC057138 TaxID=3346031 RepID=UPI00362DEE63
MTDSIRSLTRAARRDARRDLRDGPAAIVRRQRAHLAEIVAYARENSAYYRELYRDLPDGVDDPALLPVTDKKLLMAHFDDWVTDRRVTREKVEAFVADPELVGARFQEDYLVATSSGTSGLRGLFLLDERNIAMSTVLASRTNGQLGVRDALRMLAHGLRTAAVTAPGGHFYTVAGMERFRRDHPRLSRIMRVFPIDQPLAAMVDGLNRYQPATLAGFLSSLTQLAGEQEAGRLRIRPSLVIPGGETLTPEARERLATAFHAKVRAAYAATECDFLSIGCAHGWYHVNADWVVVEPVDADGQPVLAGEPSHTVLISNLANRVQPFLRYDLGDSVLVRPDPCPCGNPLPALRVEGRAADMLTFPTRDGGHASISPMLFGTLLDRTPGIDRFQVVQTGPAEIRVRLEARQGADADVVWRAVRDEIAHLLTEHKADHVSVERAEEPPEQSRGGKVRRVVPLAPA